MARRIPSRRRSLVKKEMAALRKSLERLTAFIADAVLRRRRVGTKAAREKPVARGARRAARRAPAARRKADTR